jgi:perosamine synthetase
MIPYGRQCLDEDDIQAVVEVLRSDWLTTGPKVREFEEAFAEYVGAKYAVAVSSGTAALHSAMYAIDIGPGDEVIVPPMTFASTANCVVFQGGTPVFADVDPDTLLIDPAQVGARIRPNTKAIIAVDYAGQPCEYDELRKIARQNGIRLVADGCHALGAEYKGQKVGTLADVTVFSFHPVKHITTGEGGAATTDDGKLAQRMRLFRSHGIMSDYSQREAQGTWYYEMVDLGYNYRITDIQCALGLSQLKKLPAFLARRREIAARYNEVLRQIKGIEPLKVRDSVQHAYHLYVVRIVKEQCGKDRAQVFKTLRDAGIGANVHYVPVHLHPFYRNRFSTDPGLCPAANEIYRHIISLPMHPSLSEADMERVIDVLRSIAD